MKLTTEIKGELRASEFDIQNKAYDIRKYAQQIKEQMERVIEFVEMVIDEPDKAKHFQLNPSDETAWRNLPRAIVACDTKIKGLNDTKSILRDLGVTE